MKFIAMTTATEKEPARPLHREDGQIAGRIRDALLQLFERCRGVVRKPSPIRSLAALRALLAFLPFLALAFRAGGFLRPSCLSLPAGAFFAFLAWLSERRLLLRLLGRGFLAFLAGAFLAGAS